MLLQFETSQVEPTSLIVVRLCIPSVRLSFLSSYIVVNLLFGFQCNTNGPSSLSSSGYGSLFWTLLLSRFSLRLPKLRVPHFHGPIKSKVVYMSW